MTIKSRGVLTRIKNPSLIKLIKKQRAKVNAGLDVDTDFAELRRLEKRLASDLVEASNGAVIRIFAPTLKALNKKDFPIDTKIKVRNYVIECNGRRTTAWNIKTFKDLRGRDMPRYLREFIGC